MSILSGSWGQLTTTLFVPASTGNQTPATCIGEIHFNLLTMLSLCYDFDHEQTAPMFSLYWLMQAFSKW